jgi:hypothetical protein
MNLRRTAAVAIALTVAFFNASASFSRADDAAATQPAAQVQTGEIDLTFTQRSPLSSRKEIARRLSMDESTMGDDYDLSQRPFKAYVPTDYDPATPQGIFVYLGYKNTVSSPPPWRPFLEQTHMIFISPVCHSGQEYPPAVPMWQSMGLAIDAVDNLKRLYNIDPKRIYLMSWNSGSLRMSFASADVFTGFAVTCDDDFFAPLRASNGGYYPIDFPTPDATLFQKARSRGFFLISESDSEKQELILAVMKQTFRHVSLNILSLGDDLHYPNFKLEWFQQQALPFLDAASADQPKFTAPPTAAQPPAAPAPSPADHLISMAKLYINNNRPDMARAKLQQVLDLYPNDPLVATARQMMQQLDNP